MTNGGRQQFFDSSNFNFSLMSEDLSRSTKSPLLSRDSRNSKNLNESTFNNPSALEKTAKSVGGQISLPLGQRSFLSAQAQLPTNPSPGEEACVRYFACMWGKKSGRKHKKWEGDGFIKVEF